MKNIKLLILAIIIIAIATSCKNDLFKVSVKKKLRGEWVLTDGNSKNHSENSSLKEEIYTKDSVEMFFSDGTLKVPYFETLEFKKDFTYISVQGYDFYNGFKTYTINGTWELLPAEGNYEDDERIKLTPKTMTTASPDDATDTDSLDDDYTYLIIIKELTKNNLEFDFEFTISDEYSENKITGSKKFIEK